MWVGGSIPAPRWHQGPYLCAQGDAAPHEDQTFPSQPVPSKAMSFLQVMQISPHHAVLAWRRNAVSCSMAAALVQGHQPGGAAQVPGRSAAPLPCHSLGFSHPLPGQCWLLSFTHHLPSKPTFFQQQSTTCAFPSTLITEGCSCAAKVLGSNLVNNLLPSLRCVVPPNPVITSAKLLWPQSARW